MTTLSARDEYSVAIAAGEKLTITSSVSSTGYVDRFRGSTNFGRTDITASQTLVFGPYLFGMRFNVVCQTGNISFTSSDENSAIDDIADVFRFGAVGDGVTDDSAAIQAAIDHAATISNARGVIDVDLCGRQYALASGITIKSNVCLKNGFLQAIGTTLTATDPLVDMSNTESAGLNSVEIDCGSMCAGVLRDTAKRSSIKWCKVYHFTTYGVKDTGVTQESLIDHIDIKQWLWPDTERPIGANRTAVGLWVDTADSLYCNVVSATSLCPLKIEGGLNLFSNIHTYNGGVLDSTPESLCIQVLSGAFVNSFENIYIDNGVCQLVDSFDHNFNNVIFQNNAFGSSTIAWEFVTSAAGEMANGLSLNNVIYNGSYTGGRMVFSTTGAGSWDGIKGYYMANARNADGTSTGFPILKMGTKGSLGTDGTFNLIDAAGAYKIGGAQVVGPRESGWTASTGTPNKGAYATYAGQTMSAGYVQVEAQALDDAVKAVSERLKAIEDMNRTHGLMN